jgi:hypothetical protein
VLTKEEANMSDVLKNAEMYRGKLQAEIAEVDQFLNFAGELSKMGKPEASRVPVDVAAKEPTAEQKPSELARPTLKADAAARPNSEPTPQRNGRASLFRSANATPDGDKRAAGG